MIDDNTALNFIKTVLDPDIIVPLFLDAMRDGIVRDHIIGNPLDVSSNVHLHVSYKYDMKLDPDVHTRISRYMYARAYVNLLDCIKTDKTIVYEHDVFSTLGAMYHAKQLLQNQNPTISIEFHPNVDDQKTKKNVRVIAFAYKFNKNKEIWIRLKLTDADLVYLSKYKFGINRELTYNTSRSREYAYTTNNDENACLFMSTVLHPDNILPLFEDLQSGLEDSIILDNPITPNLTVELIASYIDEDDSIQYVNPNIEYFYKGAYTQLLEQMARNEKSLLKGRKHDIDEDYQPEFYDGDSFDDSDDVRIRSIIGARDHIRHVLYTQTHLEIEIECSLKPKESPEYAEFEIIIGNLAFSILVMLPFEIKKRQRQERQELTRKKRILIK